MPHLSPGPCLGLAIEMEVNAGQSKHLDPSRSSWRLVDAARELQVAVPLVVRMQGTNVDEGKRILKDSGLAIIAAETMAEAAEKIVQAVSG
jgi:hypothetical protein